MALKRHTQKKNDFILQKFFIIQYPRIKLKIFHYCRWIHDTINFILHKKN